MFSLGVGLEVLEAQARLRVSLSAACRSEYRILSYHHVCLCTAIFPAVMIVDYASETLSHAQRNSPHYKSCHVHGASSR